MFGLLSLFCFFFFKQNTAYEMRISDWSSDVCSSDLLGCAGGLGLRNEGSGRTRPAAEALPRVKLIALASRQHACRRPAVALHRFQVRCPARRRRSVTSESEQKTLKFLFGHQQLRGDRAPRQPLLPKLLQNQDRKSTRLNS